MEDGLGVAQHNPPVANHQTVVTRNETSGLGVPHPADISPKTGHRELFSNLLSSEESTLAKLITLSISMFLNPRTNILEIVSCPREFIASQHGMQCP